VSAFTGQALREQAAFAIEPQVVEIETQTLDRRHRSTRVDPPKKLSAVGDVIEDS
jgi:hypothetical protein